MRFPQTTEDLATLGGCCALFAGINWTIAHSGPGMSAYFSSSAVLAIAGGVSVFAGARALGAGRKGSGRLLAMILVGLMCGEGYNFYMTAKTSVATQDEATAPLREKMLKHTDAADHLKEIENAAPSTMRLTAARQALADAKASGESQRVRDAQKALDAAQLAADKEAADGCKTICKQKQAEVTKARTDLAAAIAAAADDRRADIIAAEKELAAAIDEAEAKHETDVKAAKADLAANPLPASPQSLSDTTGVPPWALSLIEALLKSIGLNVMAATLIAYGAHGTETASEPKPGSTAVPVGFEPPPGTKKPRSQRQKQANAIAAELRAKGEIPKFHIVRSEYRNRHGEDCPKVTIHRACA